MLKYWSNLFLFILLATFATGQNFVNIDPKDNSPYSRLGLGDLSNQNLASSIGLAGLSAAFNDPFHLNLINPASSAFLRATAFEVGFNSEYSSLKNPNETAGLWNGNLNYLAVGFPLINPINEVLDRKSNDIGWGMQFALVPFSTVGYDIQNTETLDTLTISNNYRGSGGTYRFLWGNAFRYKDLSFGINIGYTFGKISNSRFINFDNLSTHHFFNDLLEETSIGGFYWNVGVQYQYVFKKPGKDGEQIPTGKKIIFGINANPASDFNTNTSQLFLRIPRPGSFSTADTISSATDILGSGRLPAELNLGIMYEKTNKFKLGVNYKQTNWSSYENEAKPEMLSNSFTFSVGGEFIPDIISYNNYFERVRYRFGAFYGKDPRSFGGEQLTEYGVSFGMGFPIILPRQQTSFINMALEAGQFGISDVLQETYIRMTLGFTLNDNTWFFKRKFN